MIAVYALMGVCVVVILLAAAEWLEGAPCERVEMGYNCKGKNCEGCRAYENN